MTKEFLNDLKEKGYDPKTIWHYRRVFASFPRGFTKESIERYQQSIRNLAPITQANYLAKLGKYLKLYYPKLAKEIIKVKVPEVLPKNIPDQKNVKEILQQPNVSTFSGVRDRVILELFYSTGIRRKELVNLKVDDIDRVKQIVRINEGKNKKDRLVPISKHSLQWVRRYLDRIRPCYEPKSNYFLVGKDGHQMAASTPYKIIKRYADYSCHKYRHAYATHLLENGMKETSLQRLLGHTHLTTTQIYTKVTITELQKEYRKYHPRDTWERTKQRAS